MTWIQNYNLLGNLGLSALVAAVPLFILLYMLGIRRAKGTPCGLLRQYVRSFAGHSGMGHAVRLAAMATLNGMLFVLFPEV